MTNIKLSALIVCGGFFMRTGSSAPLEVFFIFLAVASLVVGAFRAEIGLMAFCAVFSLIAAVLASARRKQKRRERRATLAIVKRLNREYETS